MGVMVELVSTGARKFGRAENHDMFLIEVVR